MDSEAPAATENLLGPRIVAGLIDLVVLAVIFGFFTIVFGDTQTTTDNGDGVSAGTSFNLSGLAFIAFVLTAWGYYLITEGLWGQTLGKKVAGIRVVAITGDLTWGKVAIRTLLRLVDGFLFYLVATVTIAVSPQHQRLGDMAAGTTVVRSGRRTGDAS